MGKLLLNLIIYHSNFSRCHERMLKIGVYYKTYSDILGKLLICDIRAVISNTASFCVTTSQDYDSSELSISPVRILIVNTRNMD